MRQHLLYHSFPEQSFPFQFRLPKTSGRTLGGKRNAPVEESRSLDSNSKLTEQLCGLSQSILRSMEPVRGPIRRKAGGLPFLGHDGIPSVELLGRSPAKEAWRHSVVVHGNPTYIKPEQSLGNSGARRHDDLDPKDPVCRRTLQHRERGGSAGSRGKTGGNVPDGHAAYPDAVYLTY